MFRFEKRYNTSYFFLYLSRFECNMFVPEHILSVYICTCFKRALTGERKTGPIRQMAKAMVLLKVPTQWKLSSDHDIYFTTILIHLGS